MTAQESCAHRPNCHHTKKSICTMAILAWCPQDQNRTPPRIAPMHRDDDGSERHLARGGSGRSRIHSRCTGGLLSAVGLSLCGQREMLCPSWLMSSPVDVRMCLSLECHSQSFPTYNNKSYLKNRAMQLPTSVVFAARNHYVAAVA